MKPQIDLRWKHPEEMTTFEFLDEHLYQVALRGGKEDAGNSGHILFSG